MLVMYVRLFAGDHIFSLKDGKLTLTFSLKLPASFFDEDGKASFRLFDKATVTYVNPKKLDLYKGGYSLSYVVDGKKLDEVSGELSEALREGKVKEIEAHIE